MIRHGGSLFGVPCVPEGQCHCRCHEIVYSAFRRHMHHSISLLLNLLCRMTWDCTVGIIPSNFMDSL